MIEIDPSIAKLKKMLKDNKQENLRNKKFIVSLIYRFRSTQIKIDQTFKNTNHVSFLPIKVIFILVGKVLEENQSPIILGAYVIAGVFGLLYLLYSPRQVRTIQLYNSPIIDMIFHHE